MPNGSACRAITSAFWSGATPPASPRRSRRASSRALRSPEAGRALSPRRNSHWQPRVAANETGVQALRRAGHLDDGKARQDLFPDDPQLQLGQPVADAAMDAEAERHVTSRAPSLDV